jgi:hypothetical protein
MAFTHTISVSYKTGAGTISSTTVTLTGDTEEGIQTVVDASAVNFFRALSVNSTQIKSMAIKATKACTIKTNTTSGVDVFALADGGAVVWNRTDTATCPITTSITGFYFDGGGVDSAISMAFLIDQPGAGS